MVLIFIMLIYSNISRMNTMAWCINRGLDSPDQTTRRIATTKHTQQYDKTVQRNYRASLHGLVAPPTAIDVPSFTSPARRPESASC
uniref:Secreted protein n=1 Tax=Oryza brachyantha TaxID=4533 RepID=J3M4S1_ORYBR